MTTTLNASTAGAGGFIATGDNSGSLALQTAGTTAVTIDTSQNVGIGVTSPSYKVDVNKGSSGSVARFGYSGGTYGYIYADTQQAYFSSDSSANNSWSCNNSSNYLVTYTNGTERMRIDSSGVLLVNATSKVSGTTYFSVQGSTNSANLSEWKDTTSVYASNNYYQIFFNSSNGTAGGVAHNAASTVAFNTSSDVRLKENIVDAPSVLDKVLNAKVRSYTWKEDKHQVQYGFIAQELYQQLPEAVGKGDDSQELTDPKGTWQVEYGRLTPMLVKAIQELKAINDTQAETINALTARVVALESRGTV